MPKQLAAMAHMGERHRQETEAAEPLEPLEPLPLARTEYVPRPTTAPPNTSVIDLFRRLDDHPITFRVDGHFLGHFEYQRGRNMSTFTCYSHKFDSTLHEGSCIKISIHHLKKDVHLDDYFYWANKYGYPCDMKPKSVAAQKRIVDTLLEFLAYAFQATTISLQDGAARTYAKCPALATAIFLVAGEQSLYEKLAGFQNAAATDAAQTVARKPMVHPLGTTMGEVAAAILRICKAEKEDLDEADTIDRIKREFKREYHLRGKEYLDYVKQVTRIDGADITHANAVTAAHELVDPAQLRPGDVIQPYICINILTS
jgi:hypothetical protein